MNAICKSKLSNKEGNIIIGDRIGLAFDLEKIEHSVYGNATELSVVLPFFSKYGEFPIPPIIQNEDNLNRLAKDLTKDYGYIWENELDEDIEIKLKDYIIIGSTCLHKFGIDVECVDGQKELMILITIFIVDDIFDNIGMDDNVSSPIVSYNNLTQVIDKCMLSGEYDTDIVTLAPCMAPVSRLLKQIKEENTNLMDNLSKKSEPFMKELKNCIVSTLIMYENDRETGERFSEDTLMDFTGYGSTYLVWLERIVTFKHTIVPQDVRDDILFRRLGMCVANTTTLMNAIFGLRRDIRLDQVRDSPILREIVYNKMTIENAFNKTVRHLQNALQDIRVAGKKLRERYVENPAVMNYIDCAEHIVDHQFYAYMHVSRYGNLGLKIQKIM